jgi:hypothetical protein
MPDISKCQNADCLSCGDCWRYVSHHPSINTIPTSNQKKEKINAITSSTQQCGLAGKINDYKI